MTDKASTQTTLDALQVLVAATPYAPEAAKEVVAASVVTKPATKSDVVARRAAPGAKKLDKTQRDEAKNNARYTSLGAAMHEIGESIGYYSIEHDFAQETVISAVSNVLKNAMKQGLEVAMLKAPTKAEPRECYTCLVDALQGVRSAAGLPPLKDATRDNYLSRIRAFVKARGAEPLDLFGNLAVKKAEQDRKLNKVAAASGTDSAEGTASERGNDTPKVDMKGIPALHSHLVAWLASNEVGHVVEKYRKMVQDMVGVLEADLPSLKK